MDRFSIGTVIDEMYRVGGVLSESDRAQVYAVTHERFPDVPLALKVAARARTHDFERDTHALASLTTEGVARVCDHGSLPDGRLFRVTERLAGPTLRQALSVGLFPPERAMTLVVTLAATVHEAHSAGLGPCDLSLDNLMFANGRDGRLCLLRVLSPHPPPPRPGDRGAAIIEADQDALAKLRTLLERGTTNMGAHEPAAMAWKPPSSLDEIRDAIARTGGKRTPGPSAPGSQIDRWQVVRRLSETLRATVYEVIGKGRQPGILKIGGPSVDAAAFTRHADMLARVQSRHVVRVLDYGMLESAPYLVMDPLYMTQSVRLQQAGQLPIDAALQTVDELLWGAEAVSKYGGAPSDFSLEHCFQATREPSPAVLTHAMVQQRSFGLVGRPIASEHADAWSAAVALYELIAGRLPFPTSKHSLAKAWMGMPIPLGTQRKDVPLDISELVHGILMGKRMSTAEVRRELTRIRSTPATIRGSAPPERLSVGPAVPGRGSAPPPGSPQARPAVAVKPDTEPDEPPHTPPPKAFRPPTPSPALRALVENAGTVFPGPEKTGWGAEGSSSNAAQRQSIEPAAPREPIEPTKRVIEGTDPPRRKEIPQPKDWQLDVSPSRCPLAALNAAAFTPDGREVVAVSNDAVARYARGQWTLDPSRDYGSLVLGLYPMREGGFLATTRQGPLLRLGPTGNFLPWGVTLDRFVFHHALPDHHGFTLVGGTIDGQRGVVARLVGETTTIVADNLDARALRGATYLGDGTLLAVGDGGTILRLRGGAVIESHRPCEVDLFATATIGDEIVVVGAGAWAFRLTVAPLMAHLESVDTLSALTRLAVDGPHVWVGSSKGRVLLRDDRHWRRMNRSVDGDPGVLALHASSTRIRAVMADGQIVLGQPLP